MGEGKDVVPTDRQELRARFQAGFPSRTARCGSIHHWCDERNAGEQHDGEDH